MTDKIGPFIPHQNIPMSNLLRARFGSGKVRIPVVPQQVMYAHFKHVDGIPSDNGTAGLNLSKLHMLDTMIERLVQLKGKGFDSKAVLAGSEGEGLDRELVALQSEYKRVVNSLEAVGMNKVYGLGLNDTGSFLNMLV